MPNHHSAGLATALFLAGGAAAMFLVARGAGRTEAHADVERPRQGLSRRFDVVFDLYRGDIPLAYLRALAKRESNMHPHERSGPAWGLLQVVEVVRRDYNERHGTEYTRGDLLRPTVNVAMTCDVLQRIITSYARNHPNVPNLQADWDNPRFVELLTFGWLCAPAHNHPYVKSGVMRPGSETPSFLVGLEQVEERGRSHNA